MTKCAALKLMAILLAGWGGLFPVSAQAYGYRGYGWKGPRCLSPAPAGRCWAYETSHGPVRCTKPTARGGCWEWSDGRICVAPGGGGKCFRWGRRG